jgi:hypothetical protein
MDFAQRNNEYKGNKENNFNIIVLLQPLSRCVKLTIVKIYDLCTLCKH